MLARTRINGRKVTLQNLDGNSIYEFDRMKFFRRRQFVLGPRCLDYDGWESLKVDTDCFLTIHPDLPTTVVECGETKCALLGYVIDPYHPRLGEGDILGRLAGDINSIEEIVDGLDKLSGRFVLIAKFGKDLVLFHDAGGMRQVVYCKDSSGRVWCASQAETLAEQHGFLLDEEVLEYKKSSVFEGERKEFWLPNDRTAYKQIFQLLPNHYLDLRQGKAIRFWPVENCISQVSVKEGVRVSVEILRNSVEAACRRFELKMGISAGMDSRKTLASTRGLADGIVYFSHELKAGDIYHRDVRVPGKLLRKLGIRHHVVPLKNMSPEFRSLFDVSASYAREKKGHIAFSLFKHFGGGSTVLSSNLSEISQCKDWLPSSHLDGKGLAIVTGLYHQLAIKEFAKWLKGARLACEMAGLNILALFHWEQKAGRWAAAGFGEYDITHESFTPYNNRHLNTIRLGISERYRRNRMWHVCLKEIQYAWPEVLIEPVNPEKSLGGKAFEFLRRGILHKFVTPWLPIPEYMEFLWKKRKFRIRYYK